MSDPAETPATRLDRLWDEMWVACREGWHPGRRVWEIRADIEREAREAATGTALAALEWLASKNPTSTWDLAMRVEIVSKARAALSVPEAGAVRAPDAALRDKVLAANRRPLRTGPTYGHPPTVPDAGQTADTLDTCPLDSTAEQQDAYDIGDNGALIFHPADPDPKLNNPSDAGQTADTLDVELREAVRRVIVDGIDTPGVRDELHRAFYSVRDGRRYPGAPVRTAEEGGR